VQEELGAVDAGLASSLNLTATVLDLVEAGAAEPQRTDWLRAACDGELLLAGALNEPSVAGSEMFDPAPTPSSYLRTRAVRDGDDWVITGSKAGWVSNAGAASHYLVFARTATDLPAVASTSAFWVPEDTPGLSVGPRTELLGMRSASHAEVFLDDVRVPSTALLGPEGGGLGLMQQAGGRMVVGLAAVFVGLARAAQDLALAETSTRTSWGRPLREHQAVALHLAEGAMELRAARLVVHDAARALDEGAAPQELAGLLPAAKAQAVDAAIHGAERAVKLLGGMGVTRGGGAEKLLRDAWTGWSCDFTGDVLRLGVAAAL
jgi:alkylation response protein AidB-like acyl-CoA dehydrogenase